MEKPKSLSCVYASSDSTGAVTLHFLLHCFSRKQKGKLTGNQSACKGYHGGRLPGFAFKFNEKAAATQIDACVHAELRL